MRRGRVTVRKTAAHRRSLYLFKRFLRLSWYRTHFSLLASWIHKFSLHCYFLLFSWECNSDRMEKQCCTIAIFRLTLRISSFSDVLILSCYHNLLLTHGTRMNTRMNTWINEYWVNEYGKLSTHLMLNWTMFFIAWVVARAVASLAKKRQSRLSVESPCDCYV